MWRCRSCDTVTGYDVITMAKNNVKWIECPVCGIYHLMSGLLLIEEMLDKYWEENGT